MTEFFLDDFDISEHPKSYLLYGQPKIGKTTSLVKAFCEGLLVIQSSPTVLAYYDQLLKNNPAEAEKNRWSMPDRITLNAYSADMETPIDNRALLRELLIQQCKKKRAGNWPFKAIMISEYSVFAERVYQQCQRESGNDGFGAIKLFKMFNSWICEIPHSAHIPIILDCHEQEPKYHDEDSDRKGQLKYRGGPMLPIGTELHTLAAQADYCIRMMGKRSTTGGGQLVRTFQLEADPLWIGGIRGEVPKNLSGKGDLREVIAELQHHEAAK